MAPKPKNPSGFQSLAGLIQIIDSVIVGESCKAQPRKQFKKSKSSFGFLICKK
jgi:hypothetical protein